jgi:hypothetical protein
MKTLTVYIKECIKHYSHYKKEKKVEHKLQKEYLNQLKKIDSTSTQPPVFKKCYYPSIASHKNSYPETLTHMVEITENHQPTAENFDYEINKKILDQMEAQKNVEIVKKV